MRIVIACFLIAVASAQAAPRADSVTDGLGVDRATGNRLREVISKYEDDVDALQQRRSELARRLGAVGATTSVEKLLDESLANQRARVKADEQLIARVRKLVSPQVTAHLLALLTETEPSYAEHRQRLIRYLRDVDLQQNSSPRGSANRLACDPFSAMHRCQATCGSR